TKVGENVLLVGERRLPHPHYPFASHVRDGAGNTRLLRHGNTMTANARQGATALRDFGRRIVWTSGTEAGHADGGGYALRICTRGRWLFTRDRLSPETRIILGQFRTGTRTCPGQTSSATADTCIDTGGVVDTLGRLL